MTAPRLALLHGFTGAPSSFDALAAHLAPSARVFRPALLGHHGRGPGSAEASWGSEVDRLAREIRAHLGDGVHLVGYSLGARLGLSLLASHRGLVSRATLIGARLPPIEAAARTKRAASDEAWARRLETDSLESFVDAWEAQPLFESQRALPADARARRRDERLRHHPTGLAQSLRVLGLAAMPDPRPRLRATEVAITLAVGTRDAAFLAHADEIRAHVPRARLMKVNGAGHDLILERPAELAASINVENDR
jgi:2-succinyl-6-hydroxy-2,4-cyclohexadiene-1-carboxylate synthase